MMKPKLTNIKKKYLIELGRIVVNMNYLEFSTSTAIFLLMSEKQTNSEQYYILMSIVGNERFGKIIQVLDTVFKVKVKDEKLLKDFEIIKNKALALYEKRNSYIHSMWLFAEDESFVSRMRNKKFPKIEHEYQPDIKELSKLADEITSCAIEISSLIHNVAIRLEIEKQK